MSSDDVSALGQETAETRGGDVCCACGGEALVEAEAYISHLQRYFADLRASLAERERATEAALAEAREARWGAEYAADSAAEEAEKAIAALSCALVEAERQRDEAIGNVRRIDDLRMREIAEKTNRALAAEAERDEARLSSHSFWKLASDMWEKRARAAEAALADTREALRNLLAWADETVESLAKEYSDYDTDDETAPLESARSVLAAVPPQQGAPADTDARPANK